MRVVILRICLCLAVIEMPCLWAQQSSRPAEHVILISIDGLRPEFYLDPSWPAPTIREMARRGAHARQVRGVFPTVTYPSHTTIITGALPARHGIYDNTPFEPAGQTGRWYWEEELIQLPTLWDAVRQAGLKSASVTWPVSLAAPIDWNIPEYWLLDRSSSPLDGMRANTHPADLWQEIEREATGRLTDGDFSSDYVTRDDQAAAIAAYLLETYKPALMTVHLLATDHFQHQDGRQSWTVERAVATVDRAISRIYETAERAGILDRTAFIVTGDHGFIDVHTQLAPNLWLVEAGLMEARSDRGNWRATFHSSGGSAALHLHDPADTEALDKVRELLSELPEKYLKLFRIVERDELHRVGAHPNSPLALAANPGIRFTASTRGTLLTPSSGGTHGYFPTEPQIMTGFIGFGAGFRPAAVAEQMGLEDIAPLVATLLGLDFSGPDASPPLGLLLPPTGK